MKLFIFGAFLTNFIVSFCAASGYVPVVLWTNIRSDECKPDVSVLPGEYILKLAESGYFKCLEKANPSMIKLFIAEELDESDFSLSHHKKEDSKAFTHLQSILQSTSSVFMPAVQPSSIPAFLEATLRNSFKDAEISTVELEPIERSSLDDTRRSISIPDEMIHEEIIKIPADEQYIAILTAYSAPQRRPRSTDDMYFGRQLLAVEDTPHVGINKTKFLNHDNCIYITYNNLTLMYQTDVWNLTDGKVVSGTCNENNASIELSFTALNSSGGGEKNMSLGFKFLSKRSTVSLDTWWNISSAIITHNLNGTDFAYELKIADHYLYSAPANWSWVCALPDTMFWSGGTKDKPIKQQLQFHYLQMQPFDIKNQSFSRALDCSGFLTGPIWMGTVVTLLLALIFAFGITAMARVTTMDRFDDPRGKTIQVHTHEGN